LADDRLLLGVDEQPQLETGAGGNRRLPVGGEHTLILGGDLNPGSTGRVGDEHELDVVVFIRAEPQPGLLELLRTGRWRDQRCAGSDQGIWWSDLDPDGIVLIVGVEDAGCRG